MKKAFLAAVIFIFIAPHLFAADSAHKRVRLGIGDRLGPSDLPLIMAVEGAKRRGLHVELVQLEGEAAVLRAVREGAVHIGQGTPYGLIQQLAAPVRFFYQLYTLQFFPVVDGAFYRRWRDLDGREITVHAPFSGTEALMNIAAKEQGIRYRKINYLAGSRERALAFLKGTVKATILDLPYRNFVLKEAPARAVVLPLGRVSASDEALFADRAFLAQNRSAIGILVEELLDAARRIIAGPSAAAAQCRRLNLGKDASPEEIGFFFAEAARNGLFPDNGGGELAAKNDLDFFRHCRHLKGDNLRVEDFWDLAPLKEAYATAGYLIR